MMLTPVAMKPKHTTGVVFDKRDCCSELTPAGAGPLKRWGSRHSQPTSMGQSPLAWDFQLLSGISLLGPESGSSLGGRREEGRVKPHKGHLQPEG